MLALGRPLGLRQGSECLARARARLWDAPPLARRAGLSRPSPPESETASLLSRRGAVGTAGAAAPAISGCFNSFV